MVSRSFWGRKIIRDFEKDFRYFGAILGPESDDFKGESELTASRNQSKPRENRRYPVKVLVI